MIIIYRLLINLLLIFSPLIIIYRILINKEDKKRFIEKFSFSSIKRKKGNLYWFHGASVGELKSIIPLLIKFEKDKTVNQILVTSNTLSSSKILKQYNLKKVVHQFFPIDSNFIMKKFINHWKPNKVFLIDSEIWPNLIFFLNKIKIPLILLNARITKKTFLRWSFLKKFSEQIFAKFNICLTANLESQKYLKKLKAKNIKYIGNLKFIRNTRENFTRNQKFVRYIKNKKVWCASSTHENEELICGLAHKNLKKKYKNLLTVIIPRHINRVGNIKNDLEKSGLTVQIHKKEKKIQEGIDIYLVSSYGETAMFYSEIKNILMGGSLIKHGGQNPLEAIRFGCRIINGPFVSNFKEIYDFLIKERISTQIKSLKNLSKLMDKLFSISLKTNIVQNKIRIIGDRILEQTYNEIKKT
jgi:3-deoxy-D-manno-octulosonic-acid transferase